MDHTKKYSHESDNQDQETTPAEKKAAESSGSEAESYREQFLRVSADFQNYRRRMEAERGKLVRMGEQKVLEHILSVLDELDLALKSAEQHAAARDVSSWLEGFRIMKTSLEKRLKDLGVEEIDCRGMFDPHLHEALMHVDAPGHQPGEIVEVFSRGYLFHDAVIRHAKVSVAK